MGRGKHPVGRIVRAINIPLDHKVIACELMMPYTFEGKEYGRGYYAIMEGEDVVKMVDFRVFRKTYLPICTWQEYDAGWNESDEL